MFCDRWHHHRSFTNDDLAKVYPPATNQHGKSVWPILQLTLAHELESGVALRPEFGAMYGQDNVSEAEQCESLAKAIAPRFDTSGRCWIRHFSSGLSVCPTGHTVLFRLTNARFKAMLRCAQWIETIDGIRKYQLLWKPSVKDRTSNPDLPAGAQVQVNIYSKLIANPSGKRMGTSC